MRKTIFILVVTILVIAAFFYFSSRDKNVDYSNITPEISLLENSPREIKLKTNVPLLDISMENVSVYTVSSSVGNAGVKSEFPDEDFEIYYDMERGIITITDVGSDSEDLNENFGSFSIGCAACIHEVELSGIKTIDGRDVEAKKMQVY